MFIFVLRFYRLLLRVAFISYKIPTMHYPMIAALRLRNAHTSDPLPLQHTASTAGTWPSAAGEPQPWPIRRLGRQMAPCTAMLVMLPRQLARRQKQRRRTRRQTCYRARRRALVAAVALRFLLVPAKQQSTAGTSRALCRCAHSPAPSSPLHGRRK